MGSVWRLRAMTLWWKSISQCCFIITLLSLLIAIYARLHGSLSPLQDYLVALSFKFQLRPQIHPVDQLVGLASNAQNLLLSQQASTIAAAASAYRNRRGRHPPPGFDAWTQYALENNVLIIESHFDQIHHDLEPFWALPASRIRKLASSWHQIISIRNGTASIRAPRLDVIEWLPLWHTALGEIAHLLPDVDMAFNDIDEPRVVVPWEEVNAAMQVAKKTMHTSIVKVRAGAEYPMYKPLPPIDRANPPQGRPWKDDKPYWLYVREACHPESEARQTNFSESELLQPPVFETASYNAHTFRGFVKNATTSRSPCSNPELRYLHGALIAPGVQSTSTSLFPLFGGCKITGVTNEILVPAAYYFSHDAQFDGGGEDDSSNASTSQQLGTPWHDKKRVAFWRGAATGGAHTADNWRHFQRHRLVAMLNATQLAAAAASFDTIANTTSDEQEPSWTHNFALPNSTLQDLRHLYTQGKPRSSLAEYARTHADAAFTHQMCFPQDLSVFGTGQTCSYTSPFYSTAPQVPLPSWISSYRVLPDVDGQSYSGRFRAYMRHSGALVVKGSIFDDWTLAGGRLSAWAHYVPMTAGMGEWWAPMDYFLPGASRQSRRDERQTVRREAQAKKIASDGREWAGKVLRREDMLAYMYRLVLEYARLCAEERESMGWIGDLQ